MDLNIAMTRVWTYCRAQWLRPLRSQIGSKAVQPEPAGRGKSDSRVSERRRERSRGHGGSLVHERPSGAFPGLHPNPVLIRDLESPTGAKPEVYLFGGQVLVR